MKKRGKDGRGMKYSSKYNKKKKKKGMSMCYKYEEVVFTIFCVHFVIEMLFRAFLLEGFMTFLVLYISNNDYKLLPSSKCSRK